jgi:hypothetical protein
MKNVNFVTSRDNCHICSDLETEEAGTENEHEKGH